MNAAAQQSARAVAYELIDRGSPHLVVLLHGLGGDRNQPLGLTTDRLASTGVSVLAPDARAHGETTLIGQPADFTTPALAQDVLDLVEDLGLGDRPLIPVGISMGAAVALQLVLDHPDRVAGAVLIRPSFVPEPWPAHSRIFRTVAALLRRDGAAALPQFQQTEQFRHFRDESASAAASLAEQFTKPLAVQRVVRLETVPGNTAVDWSGAREPGVPLAIVGAQGDPGHPLAVARLWHERLAGSTLTELPSRDQEPQSYTQGLHRVVNDTVADLTRTATA